MTLQPPLHHNKGSLYLDSKNVPTFYYQLVQGYQYFNVSSVRACVRACVCPCVTDVASTNEPRLRENTREGRDVITQYTRTSTAACVEIMRRSDNRRDYDGLI